MNGGGYVPGLPPDIAVEVPTLVSARGIQPVQTSPLPAPILAHALRDYVAPVNLELDAFERGSRTALLELLLTDPFTTSERQARELLDSILALPYHVELREHFQ
jgi:alpha-galactosidase